MTKKRRILDDCFLHDRERLRHDEAVALILERLSPVAGSEEVAIHQALGRILAEDIVAPRDVPDFANAAVDGYAVAHASLAGGESRLPVVMRVAAGHAPAAALAAGHAPAGALAAGQAARIFTGAVMPQGADTCIMQEDVIADGDHVLVPQGVKKGANTRQAGEDVRRSDRVVAAGTRLRPQEMAAIASAGCNRVACARRLRVALISTGDEVVRPGTPLARGQVYDSNHALLSGLMAAAGVDCLDFGILPDDRVAVRQAVADAARRADVILTSGGASRGEADFIVEIIQELGSLHAWQIAVKPGRPLAMGQVGDTVFFGLPGNPVAAFITVLLYVQPMLAKLQGASWRPPRRFQVPAGFAIPDKKPDRREFWRGWLEERDGQLVAMKFPRDGSGLITGLTRAEGLIEVAEEVTRVAPGDMLAFIPFSEFGLPPACPA
jgi:molybdopterin molybdotransferase